MTYLTPPRLARPALCAYPWYTSRLRERNTP
nr:MAG TPA: Seripauperin and TIP1 family [Caudoviricetes sp.]